MEINGFKIDKHNQYGIKEDAKTSICPLCSHDRKKKTDKCAQIFWDTGLGVCHHCNNTFQLHTYQKKTEVKNYTLPVFKNNTDLSDKVVKWFEDRGVSQFTLRLMNISEGLEWMPQNQTDVNTIQFNYFKNEQLINIKYRSGSKGFKLVKGAERIFYNLDAISISKEVIIVEGEIDALSYIECGLHNCVSVPNGSTVNTANLDYLDNCIEYFENKDKIYLALDSDEAGQCTTKEMIRRFGADKCYLVDFKDCKDANEYLVKYGKIELTNTLENAKEVPIDGVSSLKDWQPEFENYLLNGFHSGFKIGKTDFDDIFSTYTGQYIVVTGVPSSGKSDWVDEMVIGYQKQYGWKTAIASPENKPNEIHAGKIIAKLTGQWVKTDSQINTEWFPKAVDWIDTNIKYIDMDGKFELEEILNKAQRLVTKFGIKCLVLDPYNKIKLGRAINKNVNEYTNEYLLLIDEFARKNDVLVILVAHPVKMKRENGIMQEPTFYDIKGGGEFYDMSPHGLLVARDYVNNCTMVKVLKVKFSHLGKNQEHRFFNWNEKSGRYSPYVIHTDSADDLGQLDEDNSNWFDDYERKEIKYEQNPNRDIEPNHKFDMEEDPECPF